MKYRYWTPDELEDYTKLMLDPKGCVFPPTLWNPAAGLLITMYKSIDETIMPEVRLNLSITPPVVAARYGRGGVISDTWTEDILKREDYGTIILCGRDSDFIKRSPENEKALADAVRSVIAGTLEFGPWFECLAENGSSRPSDTEQAEFMETMKLLGAMPGAFGRYTQRPNVASDDMTLLDHEGVAYRVV